MRPTSEATLQRLLDKQAISELQLKYCRGIDRRERALVESVYWPDAHENHIGYSGPAAGFFDYVFSGLGAMPTSHMVSNILVEFDSEVRARCETYYLAYHDHHSDSGAMDIIVGGRYLDVLSKRREEWRIQLRTLTADFCWRAPGTAAWSSEWLQTVRERGGHYPDDALYRVPRDPG